MDSKVSIIVPVYNTSAYLRQCLDSLVNQTYRNIEIIVIDDGSTDGSDKIAYEYASNYTTVFYYRKENDGVSMARNFALEKATGEYIIYVDSDDYVAYDIVEKLLHKMTVDKCDIVTSDFIKFYSNGKTEYYKTNREFTNIPVLNYIIGDSGACAKLFKREIIEKEKFRKLSYEDLDIIPVLALYTNRIGYVNEGLYYYRQVEGSATRQASYNEKMLDILKVLDNVYDKLYSNYPDEVEYLFITHLLRTTTLRLIPFKNTGMALNSVYMTMKEKFPNWKNNKYYKMSSKKMKLVCQLAYHRQYGILKFIAKITNK